MPPTARKSQAKELEALKKQVAAQGRMIATKDEELTKLREAAKVRELHEKNDKIPIPEGQAGRSQGYNLFEEMRVSKETYHALRTVVRHKTTQYLDITKSLRHQDKSRLRTAKLEIAKRIPFLIQYYHAAWPINPIIKQFLWSSSKSYKKAKAYLKHLKEVPAPLPDTRTAGPRARAQNGNSGDNDELDQAPTRLKTSKSIPPESSDEDLALTRLKFHPTVKKSQMSSNATVDLDVSDEELVPRPAKVKVQKSVKGGADASDKHGDPAPTKVQPLKKTYKARKSVPGASDKHGDPAWPAPTKIQPLKKAQKSSNAVVDSDASDEELVPGPAKVKAQKSVKGGADASDNRNNPAPTKVQPRARIEDGDPASVLAEGRKKSTKSNVVFSDSDESDDLSELSSEGEFSDDEWEKEVTSP